MFIFTTTTRHLSRVTQRLFYHNIHCMVAPTNEANVWWVAVKDTSRLRLEEALLKGDVFKIPDIGPIKHA